MGCGLYSGAGYTPVITVITTTTEYKVIRADEMMVEGPLKCQRPSKIETLSAINGPPIDCKIWWQPRKRSFTTEITRFLISILIKLTSFRLDDFHAFPILFLFLDPRYIYCVQFLLSLTHCEQTPETGGLRTGARTHFPHCFFTTMRAILRQWGRVTVIVTVLRQ